MRPVFRGICFAIIIGILFLLVVNKDDVAHVKRRSLSTELLKEETSKVNLEKETPIPTERGDKTYGEVEEVVFQPLGYKIREKSVIPTLDYVKEPSCPDVFKSWLEKSEKQNESGQPPVHIPPSLLANYTLFGHTHVIKGYMDDRSGTKIAVWTRQIIDAMVHSNVSQMNNYGEEGRGVYYAMKNFSSEIAGKKGIVIGSLSPWVESFPLRLGAAHVTTIEYMKIEIQDYPTLDYQHPVQIARDYLKHIEAYDWAASFSSIEHSGLGRFGDALDPFGDLKESLKTYCMLKKGGLFFIGLPFGYDTLHWNLHRIYGRMRMALMSAGFDIIDMYYKEEKVPIRADDFARSDKEGFHKQFVIVLRKR